MSLPKVALQTSSCLTISSDRSTHAELLMQACEDGILLDRVLAVGWLNEGRFTPSASWQQSLKSVLKD